MRKTKRVFLIVLDSLGIGALPDAVSFGDTPDVNTLFHISREDAFSAETLQSLGLGYIDGVSYIGLPEDKGRRAAVARMAERSPGKDTTIGHWEIAGVVSDAPLPTFPNGFPKEILDAVSKATGRGILCNEPYSGTKVIHDFGRAHIATGDLIVYTSADSVFQIAAHEDVIPPAELYEICETARAILTGKYGVGRVIARPFIGEYPNYTRTSNRHDYSLEPPAETVLDAIKQAGMETIAVGKITDIFAGCGITKTIRTKDNEDGMRVTDEIAASDFTGLCFVNLVEFDSHYGHRNDAKGYAAALTRFDRWLAGFLPKLKADDVLMITADHGCDPTDTSTDHTREYTPLLVVGDNIRPVNLGTRNSFSDIAATASALLGVPFDGDGVSFAKEILREEITDEQLISEALRAMRGAYAPYSSYKVGAALLTDDGRIFTGCNIENASYGATVCAERVAVSKAVSDGAHSIKAIAIVGGKDGAITDYAPPCGICRQVLSEFCDPDTRVLLFDGETAKAHRFSEILPLAFGKENVL